MNIKDEILDLERKYWQAIKDRDVEAALNLTDESCIVVGPQGFSRLRHEDFKAMMESANYKLEHFEIKDNVEFCCVDDDTAVIAYEVHEELTVDGEPVSLDAAESSVWTKRNGEWVCSLHTESLRGDPFGRDRSLAKAS